MSFQKPDKKEIKEIKIEKTFDTHLLMNICLSGSEFYGNLSMPFQIEKGTTIIIEKVEKDLVYFKAKGINPKTSPTQIVFVTHKKYFPNKI